MVETNKLYDLFGHIHTQVAGEVTRLMDGFYHNVEDGLFELAYAHNDQAQQRHVVETMRELRFRRKQLLQTFKKRIQTSGQAWLGNNGDGPELMEERMMANAMAGKCAAHFGSVLQAIAERTAHATARDVARVSLPISPEEVSYGFLVSCRSVKFDKETIDMVQNLFCRFVLDRLGLVYGQVNTTLEEAGYLTLVEMPELMENSA